MSEHNYPLRLIDVYKQRISRGGNCYDTLETIEEDVC
jgi:hypothetical protein